MNKLPEHVEKWCDKNNLDKETINRIYKRFPNAIEICLVQQYDSPKGFLFDGPENRIDRHRRT